jgi:hypothetical protein
MTYLVTIVNTGGISGINSIDAKTFRLIMILIVDSDACIIINGERDFLWPLRWINHLNLQNLLE